ncbi:hypothetical protein BV22DRAFT_1036622 [Leucogyrophana mollusca]|uniref:Uncharacterized protein n=1 Tax=Leucogyrophana mollusca TaxID=85980 RepID=A0ACB8BD79_9AGAM|nr:hypothetical protein BV22DRAFT_1036622 [Leucogyrophana mollusca]
MAPRVSGHLRFEDRWIFHYMTLPGITIPSPFLYNTNMMGYPPILGSVMARAPGASTPVLWSIVAYLLVSSRSLLLGTSLPRTMDPGLR